MSAALRSVRGISAARQVLRDRLYVLYSSAKPFNRVRLTQLVKMVSTTAPAETVAKVRFGTPVCNFNSCARSACTSELSGKRLHTRLLSVGVHRQDYDKLCDKLREISTLGGIGGLLQWDEAVMMPAGAAESRGKQKSVLAGVVYEKVHRLYCNPQPSVI